MKFSVKTEISNLQSRLLGHVSVMSYAFCQLCVKADASSLLSVEVIDGGEAKHIEDVADIYVHNDENDDVTIDVVPKISIYLQSIVMAIHQVHPEFGISIQSGDGDIELPEECDFTMDDTKYIQLTMPEVDKTRRDLINTSVDALNEVCKTRMDACRLKCEAKIMQLLAGESKDKVDEAKKAMDDVFGQYKDMCSNLTDDKKKEVEQAYQTYLSGGRKNNAGRGAEASPAMNNGQSLRME